MDAPTSIEPQPRIDTLVIDAPTGGQRRRTEYTGSVWFGSRPSVGSIAVTTRTGAARLDTPFYLPDSLPYRSDLAPAAVIAVTVATQSAAEESHQLTDYRAMLVPDPRNPAVSWLQLHLVAFTWTPLAVSYRVDVLVPPDAVLATGTAAG